MVRILDWKRSEDTRDVVHVVVQALVEGRLALVPLETTYLLVGSGLSEQAIASMMNFPGRWTDRQPCVLLRSSSEVCDYAPEISRVGRRIAARGWPGPLALELEVDNKRSLCGRLSPKIQDVLLRDGRWLTVQMPAHKAIAEALELLPGPVIAVPLADSHGRPMTEPQLTADQQAFEELAFLVDDGPTHFGGLATTVRVDGHICEVVEPGVLDQSVLIALSQFVVLFVCTGNTCRSPMAETLLRAQLGERFKGLFAAGQAPPAVAVSAGLSAYPGGAPSPEAVTVMQGRGLSLKDHQSRPLTPRLLKQADLILTMTASHRHAIIQRWPEAAAKTFLLSNNGQDVADPFGGPTPAYAAAADEIECFLKPWVAGIDESWLPHWKA